LPSTEAKKGLPFGTHQPSQDTVIARDSSDEEEERGCKLPEAPGAGSGLSTA